LSLPGFTSPRLGTLELKEPFCLRRRRKKVRRWRKRKSKRSQTRPSVSRCLDMLGRKWTSPEDTRTSTPSGLGNSGRKSEKTWF